MRPRSARRGDQSTPGYDYRTGSAGELRIEVAGRSVSGSSIRSGLRGDDQELRREVHDYLTFAMLDLAGM